MKVSRIRNPPVLSPSLERLCGVDQVGLRGEPDFEGGLEGVVGNGGPDRERVPEAGGD